MINKYWDSLVFGTGLTALTYVIGFGAGWADIHNPNWLEFFAVWTSYICTLLCVYQSRWNYPIGAVSTIISAILFYQIDLPAVGLFNILLSINLIYGWFRWRNDDDTRPVGEPSMTWWIGYAGIAAATYVLVTVVNSHYGYSQTWLDITTAVVYAVAQAMLDNKHKTSWVVFFILNVLSIYLFFKQGLYFVALQYVAFLLNTLYGYYEWNKSKEVEVF